MSMNDAPGSRRTEYGKKQKEDTEASGRFLAWIKGRVAHGIVRFLQIDQQRQIK